MWARLPTEVTGAALRDKHEGHHANDSNLTSGTLTPGRDAGRGNRRDKLVRDHSSKAEAFELRPV